MIAMLELGSAWMLAWLAAAGIPLALHLLHRRRQQEMHWAAMELLLQAIRQNSRTVRIEQWLLLLLRMFACLLFAIAIARPWFRGNLSSETALAAPPKLWILVLDTSYSMGYQPQRQSLWQMAQQRAVELVEQAADGDSFCLIELSEPSISIIAQPTFERARAIEQIQQMNCNDAGSDLSSSLELVRQSIEDAKHSNAEQSDVQIVFLSDLGRDCWQIAVDGSARRGLQELARRHNVRIESFAADSPSNVAVTAFEADVVMALRGKSVRLTATIQNFGKSELTRFPVQFQSVGKTLQTEFVDCPPGQSRSLETEIQPTTERSWNASVVIPNDRLTIDDRRDLIIAIKPQIRIATIEDKSGASRFVNLSLAPQQELSRLDVGLTVVTWSVAELAQQSLENIDAVVLVDVLELRPDAIAKLNRFVESGGAVLALIGPRASSVAWNQETNSSGELFGFDLKQPSDLGDWRVDPLNYASPIAKPFANFSDAGLLTTPIFRYWKVASRASQSPIVDLGFTNGDAWLMRRRLGSGWTAALLSSPETGTQSGGSNVEPWNAMATWPSFLPIMQKVVETICSGGDLNLNVNVGQPLSGRVAESVRQTEISIRRPDQSISHLTIAPTSDRQSRIWTIPTTDRAGIYQVALSESEVYRYAVNIVANQSDLQSVSETSLPLSLDSSVAVPSSSSATLVQNAGQSEWLSRYCLWALLLTLSVESLLAWHLGRRLT